MSERITTHDNRAAIRWKLLTGASALALTAYVSSIGIAKAEDATHPLIWLELNGQFSMQKNDLEVYNPDFLSASPFDAESHIGFEKAPPKIWDKGGSISFQPQDSDWILSGSIRFGKTARSLSRDEHNPTSVVPSKYSPGAGGGVVYNAYQHPIVHAVESHTILDFQAGKDVGLGKFGRDATSAVNLGVRIAQFDADNGGNIKSQPTSGPSYNKFYASFDAKRSFKGIGPSLSWDASAMIGGNRADGGLSLDWGVNGAVLFGRQKMSEHHQTKENHWPLFNSHNPTNVYQNTPLPVSRSKRVTVPNLGAFAGVSWRYADAKITMGYRADYFFNVLDGGIATAKKEDRAFYGPFLSIAVGIGD